MKNQPKIEASKVSVSNRGHFYLFADLPPHARQTLSALLDQVAPPRKGSEVTRGYAREASANAAFAIYSYSAEPNFLKGTCSGKIATRSFSSLSSIGI